MLDRIDMILASYKDISNAQITYSCEVKLPQIKKGEAFLLHLLYLNFCLITRDKLSAQHFGCDGAIYATLSP